MPTYCYTTTDGEITVERVFAVGKAPGRVHLANGQVARRDVLSEHAHTRSTPSNWPMQSDALGVHPNQISAAMAEAEKYGVPTEFATDGRAILTSPGHRKRYAELYGIYDRNGGYRDPKRR